VSAPALSPEEYSEVERFGMTLPFGADDGIRYAAGDVDPTPEATAMVDAGMGLYCAEPMDHGFKCSWPTGHEHPQHVAGGTRGIVYGVSDVVAPATAGSSLERLHGDEHVRAMRRGFLVVGAGLLVVAIAVVLIAWWLR
jgi:hypothetical protein